jgi:hypothetical protein
MVQGALSCLAKAVFETPVKDIVEMEYLMVLGR